MDFNEIKALLLQKELPSHDYLFSLLDKTSSLLEQEICLYRPASSEGTAGSLLEFNSKKPVIIVPDIHARPDFLLNILSFTLPGFNQTVFESLAAGTISIICVGDAVHSERQNKERWLLALDDYYDDNFTGLPMTQEMTECFSVICAIMELKNAFPSDFHFLKGNHENIMNKTGSGDFAFRKFADEGNMTRDFIHSYYGEDILYLISLYENALPLVYANPFCVVSHAEPRRTYSRQELINARLNSLVVEGLTWTRNGEAEEGCVQNIINDIFEFNGWGKENAQNALYFAGHSPVQGDYALRQRGRFVQIHNPFKQNVVLAGGKEPFDFRKNIINVQNSFLGSQEEHK